MDASKLQDRLSWGMGAAARHTGDLYTVFRPSGTSDPLGTRNRIIRLPAAFTTTSASPGSSDLVWNGRFDSSYTLPGDFLTGPLGTFFIAAQRPLQPVQCVLANQTINIVRPTLPQSGAYNALGPVTTHTVLNGWPACLRVQHAHISGTLRESHVGFWLVLLPVLPAAPQVADVVIDGSPTSYAVTAAEQTDLGWRLLARQIAG